MTGPISVIPDDAEHLVDAVTSARGQLVPLGAETRGLIWSGSGGPRGLAEALEKAPDVEWVQLPAAGIESFTDAGVVRSGIRFTAAQGAYSAPVAEHTVALVLASLRQFTQRARATSWGESAGLPLYGRSVLIVGGGGIAEEIARLLAPFDVSITALRRNADRPVAGAERTVGSDALHEELARADVVIVALALVPATVGMFGAEEFAAMKPDAVLVNIARGRHIDTDALVASLESGRLYGVGLDVTDPEPLPEGHPLWSIDRVLITPHTANTKAMLEPLFAERVRSNVERYVSGGDLIGEVDIDAGY